MERDAMRKKEVSEARMIFLPIIQEEINKARNMPYTGFEQESGEGEEWLAHFETGSQTGKEGFTDVEIDFLSALSRYLQHVQFDCNYLVYSGLSYAREIIRQHEEYYTEPISENDEDMVDMENAFKKISFMASALNSQELEDTFFSIREYMTYHHNRVFRNDHSMEWFMWSIHTLLRYIDTQFVIDGQELKLAKPLIYQPEEY
jgi:hypothetical protein